MNIQKLEVLESARQSDVCEGNATIATFYSTKTDPNGSIRARMFVKASIDALQANERDTKLDTSAGDPAVTKRNYIIEVDLDGDGQIVDAKILTASGDRVPSKEILDLAAHMDFVGKYTLGEETASDMHPGQLYILRSGGGVCYFEIASIENGKVFVMESNKEGEVNLLKQAYQLHDPQRLVLAKHQPNKNNDTSLARMLDPEM